VTEAYLYNPDIMAKINSYIKIIEELLVEKEIVLSDDVELFIQVGDDDFTYYFVDHTTRTQFWLDEFDTDDLGLSSVVSATHLSKDISHTCYLKQLRMALHIQN
jgi:hypothetical protein